MRGTGIANGVFPAAVLAMQHRQGHVTLGACCKVLAVVLCGTLAAKLALEERKSFPDYSVHGRRAAGASGSPGAFWRSPAWTSACCGLDARYEPQ